MELTECDESTWDEFAAASPEGTIYARSCLLKGGGRDYRFLLCREGGTVLGGAALPTAGDSMTPMPFQAYNGLLFADLTSFKPYKRVEKRFAVAEAFAARIFSAYARVTLANHWGVQDVRPFDWLNYHDRAQGYFKVDVRYTSLLNIEPGQLRAGFKEVRVNSLKTAEKQGLRTEETDDVSLMDSLHDLTFKRQGLERSSDEAAAVRNICVSLLGERAGRLFVTYKDRQPASACFLGLDRHRAYYCFGASDPELRKTESGTKNLVDAIELLQRDTGRREIDLLGVNSPQRGAFKLSFGGALVPYYNVTKVQP